MLEIRNRYMSAVIHRGEFENIRELVEDAVSKLISLRYANLRDANLRFAKNYYSFVAYDTSKRTVHCIKHGTTWMVKAGCFWGTLDELETKVKETHNSKVYLANIEILRNLRRQEKKLLITDLCCKAGGKYDWNDAFNACKD